MARNDLYADIRINNTLCERYKSHMSLYGRDVLKTHDKVLTGSSDIGNVSYVVPTIHTMFAIPAPDGSFPHHSSFTEAAGEDEAHDEAIIVGKSLALIGWEMLTDEGKFSAARKDWEESIQ